MRRTDADIIDANADMEYLYRVKRRLKWIDLRLKELDALLDCYGVSSPQFKSAEEAKYQRGTRIYTDMPLLELFAEQDLLQEECRAITAACELIQNKLDKIYLTKADERILNFIYVRRYTYQQVADRMHFSRQAVMKKHDRILRAYSELQQ